MRPRRVVALAVTRDQRGRLFFLTTGGKSTAAKIAVVNSSRV